MMTFDIAGVNHVTALSVNYLKFDTFHRTDNSAVGISHSCFGCITKGKAVIEYNGTETAFSTGELMHLPKGLHYVSRWYGEPEVEFYSIPYSLATCSYAPFFKKDGDFRDVCKRIFQAENSWIAMSAFYELYDCSGAYKHTGVSSPVHKAVQFIEENPVLDYHISHLAKLCNMSESSFYHIFRKVTGFSPVEYRNSVRCREAVRLLKTTDRTVEGICTELNFSSSAYLRRVLKSFTGKTPGEIRSEGGMFI